MSLWHVRQDCAESALGGLLDHSISYGSAKHYRRLDCGCARIFPVSPAGLDLPHREIDDVSGLNDVD